MTAERRDRVSVPSIKCNGKYKVAQAYIKIDGVYKLVDPSSITIKVRNGSWGSRALSTK